MSQIEQMMIQNAQGQATQKSSQAQEAYKRDLAPTAVREQFGVLVDTSARPRIGAQDPFSAIRPGIQQDVLDKQREEAQFDRPGAIESLARAPFRIIPQQAEQRSGALQAAFNEIMTFGEFSDPSVEAFRSRAQQASDLFFNNYRQRMQEIQDDPLIRKPEDAQTGITGGWDSPVWYASNVPEVIGGLAVDLGAGVLFGPAGFAASATTSVAGTTYPEAYQSALQSGLSPEQAHRVAFVESGVNSAVTYAVNKVGFDRVFGRTPIAQQLQGGAARVYFQQIVRSIGLGGAVEGITEGVEEFAQVSTMLTREVTLGNITPAEAVDQLFSYETLDRIMTGTALGAIGGASVNATIDTVSLRGQRAAIRQYLEANRKTLEQELAVKAQEARESLPEPETTQETQGQVEATQEPPEAAEGDAEATPPMEGDIALTGDETSPGQRMAIPQPTAFEIEQARIDKANAADARFAEWISALAAETESTRKFTLPEYQQFVREATVDLPTAIKNGIRSRATRPTAKNIDSLRKRLGKYRTREARGNATKALSTLKKVVRELDPDSRTAGELLLMQTVAKAKGRGLRNVEEINRIRNENPGLAIPAELVDRAGTEQTAIDEMSRYEAEALTLAIAAIREGRIDKESRDRVARYVKSVDEELEASLSPAPRGAMGRVARRTGEGTALLRLAGGVPENSTAATLAEILGNGRNSTMYDLNYGAFDRSQNDGLAEFYEYQDTVAAAMRADGLTESNPELWAMSAEIARSVGEMESFLFNRKSGTTATPHRVGNVEFTAFERAYLWATLQDPESYEMIVIEGQPVRASAATESLVVTPEIVAQLQRDIPAREKRLVETILAVMNGPAKASIREWSSADLGMDVTRPGTYFPRHRQTSVPRDQAVTPDMLYQTQTLERAGILKERSGAAAGPIEIRDILVEANRYFWQVAMLTNMATAIRDANTVLNSPEVSERFRTSTLSRAKGQMQARLNALTQQAMGNPGVTRPFDTTMRRLIRNSAVAVLGANPAVPLYQPVSLLAATAEIDEKYIYAAVMEGAATDFQLTDRMHEASAYIRWRDNSSQTGLVVEGGLGDLRIPNVAEGRNVSDRVKNGSMMGIRAMDSGALRVIWRASEIMAEVEGGEAVEIAERVVKFTQPTWDILHISGTSMEAREGGMARFFTVFRSQRAKNLDILIRSGYRTARGQMTPGKMARNIAVVYLAQNLSVVLVKTLIKWVTEGPDEPEEEAKKMWARVVDSLAGEIVLGEYLAAAINGVTVPSTRPFGVTSNPMLSLGNDTVMGLKQVRSGANQGDVLKMLDGIKDSGAALTSLVTGLPLVSPNRYLEDVIQRMFGDEEEGGERRARPAT